MLDQWKNRAGQTVAMSYHTVRVFDTEEQARQWLRAGGKRQQPRKRVEALNREEVRNMRKMAAVNMQTGQVETLNPEARRRIETQLNVHGDLEGLVAFANERGDIAFAAESVPYYKDPQPRVDAEYREWYEKRLAQERGR